MQSQQPMGERQAAPPSDVPAHPAQAHSPQTDHPSLPSQIPAIPAPKTPGSTSPNQTLPRLVSTPNQVVVLPRPRGNIFAQNKPIDTDHPNPSTPHRDQATFNININSKALSEGHKAIQQTLWTAASGSGVQEINIPGIGKRLVRRTTPASPLSTSGPTGLQGISGVVGPSNVTSPLPARQRNSVFSPFIIPSSTLSPSTSLEAIEENEVVPAQDQKTKVTEEGKTEKEVGKSNMKEEGVRAGLDELDERERRMEGEEQHASSTTDLRFGIGKNGYQDVANQQSTNSRDQLDDRARHHMVRDHACHQADPRSNDIVRADIRDLRAEQHKYYNQNHDHEDNLHYPEHNIPPPAGPRSRTNVHLPPPRQGQGPTAHSDQIGPKLMESHTASHHGYPQQIRAQLLPPYEDSRANQDRNLQEKQNYSFPISPPIPSYRSNRDSITNQPQGRGSQHQRLYKQDFNYGGRYQDPFIDHTSPPKSHQKRSRPQDYPSADVAQQRSVDQDYSAYERAPKRHREQSVQTEPSSEKEVPEIPESQDDQDQDQEPETPFDPTAPIEPYDYIKQIQEPWNEAMAQHVPYIDEWAERFISTSIDYVLAVYKCSHKSSLKLGESLQEGVDDVLAQQAWQNGRRQTFIDFRKQMAKVAQALGDIDPEDDDEDMPVSPAKNRAEPVQ